MYFPVGWPRVLNVPQLGQCSVRQVVCNRDKILFAILTDDCLSVWFCKVSLPNCKYDTLNASCHSLGCTKHTPLVISFELFLLLFSKEIRCNEVMLL
jgi:hypothetical protein